MKGGFDLVVVGAGPGGLAAAATAAEAGLRVCLIDDNPAPGGQIWRHSAADSHSKNTHAARWLERIKKCDVDVRSGWRVVAETADSKTLRIEADGRCCDLAYSSLILATGARELFLPFPGWTLPGVYGAGGLQAFVKSGLEVSGKRIVVAGTGPLLLAVAAYLRSAGAYVIAIVEQASVTSLARFSMSLLAGHTSKLIEGANYGWKTLGVPFRTGSWVSRATGEEHLRSITITSSSRTQEIEADVLAVGFHLIPNTELPQLLHCELDGSFVHVDAFQETSVKGIYCVGEVTGIGGVEKAQIEGRIAALAIAGKTEDAKRLFAARDRQVHFARRLDSTFSLRDELRALPDDSTMVCRCEDVTHQVLTGCHSWREAKLHTRCGMGPCQGRVCSPAAQFLYRWQLPTPRPPLFPVSLATLSGQQERNI